jgi:hypothetical protein
MKDLTLAATAEAVVETKQTATPAPEPVTPAQKTDTTQPAKKKDRGLEFDR